MLKMTIDNEEVLSNNDISIKEEILSPSSTILNNVYPKSWELDKDYTSRFYYPKDYSKLNIQNFSIEPEEAGKTIQVNGNATLTDVDTSKESRVLRILGQTSQTGTPTPSSPIPINVVSGDNTINVCGKNLLNLNGFTTTTQSGITLTPNFENGKLVSISTSGTFSSSTYILLTNTQKIQPNKQYTLSGAFSASARLRLREYDSNNTQLSEYFDNGYGVTFTSKSNVDHINIQAVFYASNPNAIFYPMIEVGSTKTTYEPYIGHSYPIYLGVENLFNGTLYNAQVGSNGSITSNTQRVANVNVGGTSDFYLQTGTYTLSIPNLEQCTCLTKNSGGTIIDNFANAWQTLPFTFTLTQPGYLYFTGRKTNNSVLTPSDYTPQVEKGSKVNHASTTPIELCKIGNYQDYFAKSDGRNLFDKDKDIVEGYTFGNDDILISTTDFFYQAYYIPVEPNTTYSFIGQKTLGSDSLRVCEYTSDKTFIQRNYELYTITTTQNTHYIRVSNYKDKLNTTQVEKGSSATLWQPYGVGKWYKYGAINYVMFDGSEDENWLERSSTSADYWKVRYDGGLPTFITGRLDMITNYFVPNGGANDAGYSGNAICGNAGQYANWVHISIDSTIANSVASFKNWLSTHNLKVYYVQATPTTTEITDTTLLEQLESLSS